MPKKSPRPPKKLLLPAAKISDKNISVVIFNNLCLVPQKSLKVSVKCPKLRYVHQLYTLLVNLKILAFKSVRLSCGNSLRIQGGILGKKELPLLKAKITAC